MAKHPDAGRVKTRLAAAYGAEAACALYRAFVVDLAARLATTGRETAWAVWPPGSPFGDVLPGARWFPQRGADLGERMAAATADLFAEAPTPVIVLGADVPHVSLAALDDAERALVDGTDVVLGPAADGGYYLIGLRAPTPGVFTNVAWGTATVLETTRVRAAGLGLATRLVGPDFDLDEPADVRRLRALLADGAVALPATTRVLAILP